MGLFDSLPPWGSLSSWCRMSCGSCSSAWCPGRRRVRRAAAGGGGRLLHGGDGPPTALTEDRPLGGADSPLYSAASTVAAYRSLIRPSVGSGVNSRRSRVRSVPFCTPSSPSPRDGP